MSNEAKTVLWVGLFMILFGIIAQWPVIKAALFTGKANSSFNPRLYSQRINTKTSPTNPTTAGESRVLR